MDTSMGTQNTFLSNIFSKQNQPKENSFSKVNYRNVFIIAVILFSLFFVTIFVLVTTSIAKLRYSTIELTYTPASAVVTIDGKQVSAGEVRISPGDHVILIEKYGFEPDGKTLTTYPGSSHVINLSLSSNNPATSNWYTYHPNDQKIGEGIGSYEFDHFSEELQKNYPFVKNLPVETANFSIYRSSCEGEVCFYIDADPKYRDEAIEYFKKNLNSDVGKFKFRFKNYSNPFLGEG